MSDPDETRGFEPPQPYGQPYGESSGWAICALVTGIFGVLVGWCLLGIPCIAAVIVGHKALAETRDNMRSGRGMAIAGLTMGYLGLTPAVILFFWVGIGLLGSAVLPSPDPSTAP
ncbi:DUF4190 domain-containing protein [Actinoplanes sp. NBRC 103695]|uniref:DUF4190 domain-containing protein n=1 Tax=Actinoplanes sp. NBRC 103695 TaxID=3032202 RepID=UPI0024A3EA1D|nr:DUF4190 domain-containing protein [Actinoplanes sp. NBRC 103695]GLY97322.1 hypothetical protein Acsp02_45760 [Actinoplanes sp. NBRC 103695]